MAGWVIAVVVVIVAAFNFFIYLGNENNILFRKCCKGPKKEAMLVSNRKAGVQRTVRPVSFWAWELIDPQDLYNGWGDAAVLTLYRFFCFGVFCFTIIAGNIYDGNDNETLKFFTNWTFVLWGFLTIYGASLTAEAWHHRWQHSRQLPLSVVAPATTKHPSPEQQQQENLKAWRAVHKIHLLLFEMVAAASITLTVFFWAAVYKKENKMLLEYPVKHGVSALLLLVEVFVSRVPLVSYHVQVPVLYGTVYLIFMWLYETGTQKWIYKALNWESAISIAFYIALPLLLILSYIIMFMVAGFRELIRTGKCITQCSCCCTACTCCRPDASEGVDVAITAADGRSMHLHADARPNQQFIAR